MSSKEIKELSVGSDMSSNDGRKFKKEPAINVISKEEFEERIEKVFRLLLKTLSKSFGPYGAPTIIYNYPWSHVTKDGYTIMKNLSMDASETLVDEAISLMAADICGRLNYTVGDGTTSAVIATNSIYQNYRNKKDVLDAQMVLPRDIIKKYNDIKDKIIKSLEKRVKTIRSEDPDVLYKNIYDVVFVSSNGDETMSENISDLYRSLGCPSISCCSAPDGIAKTKLIEGYKLDLTLTDKIYVNSDDNTMDIPEADIIIFSKKVKTDTYQRILVPLNEQCKLRGRNLIVAAPSYDEVALKQVIQRDLNAEFLNEGKVNMVLTTYKATSAHARRIIEDFAVLANTFVIDGPIERDIYENLDNGKAIYEIFNIDRRQINGIKNLALNKVSRVYKTFIEDADNTQNLGQDFELPELIEKSIRLGYIKDCRLGLHSSIFGGFVYDERRYKVICKDAQDILKATEAKYQKLGTFNLEVSQAQERFYALKLKMGIIEVGADSELSQKLLKDSADDAVKAAASAFNHGVVLGCNVDLISVIKNLKQESTDEVEIILYDILESGFKDVYRTVLTNAFDNFNKKNIHLVNGFLSKASFTEDSKISQIFDVGDNINENYIAFVNSCKSLCENSNNGSIPEDYVTSINDIIIQYSIDNNLVFDVSKKKFTDRIINSAQTDEEILKATIDLISLLITGNQMVVTQKHNF